MTSGIIIGIGMGIVTIPVIVITALAIIGHALVVSDNRKLRRYS